MKNFFFIGKIQLLDCVNCSSGRYCLEFGNDIIIVDCQVGYYCVSKVEIFNLIGILLLIKDIKKYIFFSNIYDIIFIYELFSFGFLLFCEYLC